MGSSTCIVFLIQWSSNGHVAKRISKYSRMSTKQGNSLQDALTEEAFGPLIREVTYLCRHDRGLESAQSIMSQLIHQESVTMMIQEELNAGQTWETHRQMSWSLKRWRRHDKEVERLKKELEDESIGSEIRAGWRMSEAWRDDGADRKTLTKTRYLGRHYPNWM